MTKSMTKGWHIGWHIRCCLCKDGLTDWIDLKHVKDSNMTKLAKYTVAHCIQQDPEELKL